MRKNDFLIEVDKIWTRNPYFVFPTAIKPRIKYIYPFILITPDLNQIVI